MSWPPWCAECDGPTRSPALAEISRHLDASCPLARAIEVVEELSHAVEAYRLEWEERSFGVGGEHRTVSVDASIRDAAAVLSAADAFCYVAKAKGRNAVAEYSDTAPSWAPAHSQRPLARLSSDEKAPASRLCPCFLVEAWTRPPTRAAE